MLPGASVEYHISQYELEQGALEIQYIEEFFGEFPRKKTASEIVQRLREFFTREVLEGNDVGLDESTPLIELGLVNSMSVLLMIGFIDREFDVLLEATSLTPQNLQTLETIARMWPLRGSIETRAEAGSVE